MLPYAVCLWGICYAVLFGEILYALLKKQFILYINKTRKQGMPIHVRPSVNEVCAGLLCISSSEEIVSFHHCRKMEHTGMYLQQRDLAVTHELVFVTQSFAYSLAVNRRRYFCTICHTLAPSVNQKVGCSSCKSRIS